MLSERFESHNQAISLLDEAKTDILMSEFRSPTHTINSLGVERVSSDFLVATLIVNVQKRKFIPGSGGRKDDDKRRGIVALFREYLNHLKVEGMRRPKRRVFVDITELQEEMFAHYDVLWAQRVTLYDTLGVFYPTGTKKHTELKYVADQLGKLTQTSDEIAALRKSASTLKDEVKQTIEVLEEGHGRAIRVFTIVTLFFLPL